MRANDIGQLLGGIPVRFLQPGGRRRAENQGAVNFPRNPQRYYQPTASPNLGKGVRRQSLKHVRQHRSSHRH